MQISKIRDQRQIELAKQWATGIALVALGGWLIWRLWDGTLNFYLHPRFNLLVGLTTLILLQLGGWQLWRKPAQNTKGNNGFTAIGLVVLVALLGLLITPHPLENSAGELNAVGSGNSNRALAAALEKQDWKEASALDTNRWSLLDWSAALNDSQRAEKLVGKSADIVGFVVHPAGNNAQYFLLSRYVVVCCTADSSALKVPVVSERSGELEEGQWVRITGTLGRGNNGVTAFVATSVERIARPAQPYIYP